MADRISNLALLHTAVIDSRNGYDEAFADARGKGLSALFRDMMSIHTHHAEALAAYLRSLDQTVDERGSFMTTVNRTAISIRSLFGGLDARIIPGLIEGEERNVALYEAALVTSPAGMPEHEVLIAQCRTLQSKVSDMKTLKTNAA